MSLVPPRASALLLEVDVFPKRWSAFSDENGTIVATRSYYIPHEPGQVFQEVYRRPTAEDASEKFKEYLSGSFNESKIRQPFVPFSPPPEITFQSQIADEYYFACGVDEAPQCKMLARYRNYFVYFYFDVSIEESRGGLTYPEIVTVLEALEAKVLSVLSNSIDAIPRQ